MRTRSGRAVVHYELAGKANAPALLMIRGLGRTRLHWGRLVDDLAADFRLVLIDNRGVGDSSAPLPPYSTASMARDAARVLQAAEIARAHVFGISLGGMIAQELAIRHPERVERLVLGCTRAGPGSGPGTPKPVVRQMIGAMRLGAERAVDATAPLILGQPFIDAHPEVLAGWRQLARLQRARVHGVVGQLLAASRHDTTDRLQRIRAKTLVVTGDADRMIPPENSKGIADRIPGARLHILPGAPHDFPTERADETAELLRDFLLG